MSERNPIDFIIINAGYEAIYGRKAGVQDAIDRLRSYTLAEILNALTRISVVLSAAQSGSGDNALSRQKYLCDILFGSGGPAVFGAALESISAEKRATAVLFYELQLANAAKLALLALESNPCFDDRKPLARLAEALLIISDLLRPSLEPVSSTSNEDWVRFFLTNGLFHSGGSFRYERIRSYDLYLRNRDHLKDDPAYLDLPGVCRRIIGLPPIGVWGALFSLLSHWTKADLSSNRVNGHLDFGRYLSQFSLSPEDFFGFSVSSTEDVQKEIRKTCSPEELRPYELLFLARAPILKLGDCYYCPSVKLLKKKLCSGLYHIFLDPSRTEKTERDRFLQFVGTIVEDYVNKGYERLFTRKQERWLDEKLLRTVKPRGKIADGLLVCGASIVVVETKATLYSLPVRTSGDWQTFEGKVNDTFVDAGEQIDETIQSIEAGILLPLGLNPKKIHNYFPLIVTLEDTAMSRLIYEKVAADIEKRGLLQGTKIRPFQNLTVSELDEIHGYLRNPGALIDLLRKKTFSDDWRSETFRNYCYGVLPRAISQPNSYLETLGDAVLEDCLRFFRENQKELAVDLADKG